MERELYNANRNESGEVNQCTDMIYSPDDNGWYGQEYDFAKAKERVTKRIYPNRHTLLAALKRGDSIWEEWR
jgi:hypothetical protein